MGPVRLPDMAHKIGKEQKPVVQLCHRFYIWPILCPTSVHKMYTAGFHISAKTEPSFCHVRILHAAHKLMVIDGKTDPCLNRVV